MQEDTDKIKVLVVDDERLVRFTIAAYLRSSGIAVVEAANPAEAIGCFKREQFHAVVSDVSMGEIDGFMFRDSLRTISTEIPIIFLTAMMNDSGNTFMSRVMEDIHSFYVAKSAPRAVLVGKIRQVVKSHLAELNVRRLESRLEKSLSLASFVQRAMLPSWTRVSDSYTYTCCWEPLSRVSGDLFEWYPLSSDSALFVFGDISGHGTTAALAMTAVQAFLKQFAHVDDRRAREVHRIAASIHEFLIANLHDVAYMATTVVYFNAAERIIRYINCGNPEPFCYNSTTGERTKMNPEKRGALPPGLFAEAEYHVEDTVEHALDPEDVMIVTSDGVYDISSDEAGLDVPPVELLHELYGVAVKTRDEGLSATSAIPYRVINALDEMGYVHHQDDMMFFVLASRAAEDDARVIEVAMRPDSIDDASRVLGEYAAELGGDSELGVKTDLLLNEHLMNVYRHGYDDFGRQHEMSVIGLARRGDELVIGVWDRGAPWKDVVDATEDEADAALAKQNDTLASGGRGRAIMRKIATRISGERFMNLNKTVFHIPIISKGVAS